MTKSEKLVDPIQSQFFTTNIVGGLTAALVRESIQNSLDANLHLKSETGDNGDETKFPVEVRFYLSGESGAIPSDEFSKYTQGIVPHVEAPGNGLPVEVKPDFSKSTPYLLIEDSNTRGLEGDPLESEDPSEDDENNHNFYWFWRNVGRSGKGHGDRGRWGLGKTVFPAASKINTFFGITVRDEDGRRLLMGQSVLKIHHVEGEETKFCPYGDFGEFLDEDEYFVSPVDLDDKLDEFEEDFNLERKDGEGDSICGLSIVIPYPADEINRSELIKAVVVQYFYPILSSDLVVVIEDENSDEPIRIDSESIKNVINDIEIRDEDSLSLDNLKKLFEFSEWSLELEESDFITFKEPGLSRIPQWRSEWYIDESVQNLIDEKVESFDKGERVAFKVPVKVHEEGEQAQMTWFKVFLEKDDSLEDSDCHFVRDGITITGIQPLRRKDLRALVVIDDSLLVKLLGDAENPAHTEWQKDSPHFKGKYIQGDRVISFVIKSLPSIYLMLLKPSEGIDEEILKDIFYIDLDEDSTDTDTEPDGDEGEGEDKPDPPGEGSQISPLKINRVAGGLNIKPNPKAKQLPSHVDVNLGYMVGRGNPLKKYNPLDFDISDDTISVNSNGVKIETCEKNLLTFKIESDEFDVSLLGFDEARDLFIKAKYYDQEV